MQTFLPRHEVLQSVLHADPSRAAKVELSRRELLGLPPFAALAAVSGTGAERVRRGDRSGGVVDR